MPGENLPYRSDDDFLSWSEPLENEGQCIQACGSNDIVLYGGIQRGRSCAEVDAQQYLQTQNIAASIMVR